MVEDSSALEALPSQLKPRCNDHDPPLRPHLPPCPQMQELCSLSKHLQLTQRQALWSKMQQLGLFEVLTKVIASGAPAVKLRATDILLSTLGHDPLPLRNFLTRQPGHELFGLLVKEMLGAQDDSGLPEQIAELLKVRTRLIDVGVGMDWIRACVDTGAASGVSTVRPGCPWVCYLPFQTLPHSQAAVHLQRASSPPPPPYPHPICCSCWLTLRPWRAPPRRASSWRCFTSATWMSWWPVSAAIARSAASQPGNSSSSSRQQ